MADRAERPLSRATSRTGLTDWGDPAFREGLEVLLESLEEEAALTKIGRYVAYHEVVAALCRRLKLRRATLRDPEALLEPPRAPLFVVGPPRSGTTLLHRMLCQAADALWLPGWLLADPLPAPPGDWLRSPPVDRVRSARAVLEQQEQRLPGLRQRHLMDPLLPEEETRLLDDSFLMPGWWIRYPVHAFARWCAGRPAAPAYAALRQTLQLLQRARPGGRWVLKSPLHLFSLAELMEAFPAARVVLLHRDPVDALPSLHGLLAELHGIVSAAPRTAEMVAANTRALAAASARLVELGNGPAADRFVRVRWSDLVADPTSTVRSVHEALGLRWGPELAARVARMAATSQPQPRRRERPEDFDQTAEALRKMFATTDGHPDG